MTTRTLYLCYFGLREPLVQTQVLPYLRQLVRGGVRVGLMTFEPKLKQRWTRQELDDERERLAAEGIQWHYRAYHKTPSLPATLYDIASGARAVRRLVRREGIRVLHSRGHIPALMAALVKRTTPDLRTVFDIRGFMPEEYTDAGVWPEGGYLYRGMKRVERYLLSSSDAFVVLTKKAREILFPGSEGVDKEGRPVEVIPCCVDFRRYEEAEGASREELRRELNLTGRRVLVYVGSFGGWYMTDEMLEFLALAHRRDETTFSMILTQSPAQEIAARLRALGLSDRDFFIDKVKPNDVPRYLKAADVALSFIKPCYSKLSSSPTKIAEYLASGLPIVCNAGIGDVDEIIEGENVGVVIGEFNEETYTEALRAVDEMRLDETLGDRCRASARRYFDLDRVGGERYRRLYRRLVERSDNDAHPDGALGDSPVSGRV